MKTTKIFLLACMLALLPSLVAVSQPILTTATSVTSCPATIQVPIKVQHCNGVAAISLALNYNTSLLSYSGYTNVHPALSNGFLIVNAYNGKVIVSWASMSVANVGNDTLLTLKFNAASGTSPMIWDTITPGNCEYSNINGVPFPAHYYNGTEVIHFLPVITSHPQDKTVIAGENTSFAVGASGTGLSFQWQVSTNGGANWDNLSNTPPYSGVNSATLQISGATVSLNGYKYQCTVSGTCPPGVVSNPATLTVFATISVSAPTISTCPGLVTIPVQVTNCNNIGAISLVLNFSPAVLQYVNYQNPHPELASGNLVVSCIAGKVYFNWASLTPANVGNGVLVELVFNSLSIASTPLTWFTANGQCEFSNSGGQIVRSEYANGNVTILQPPLITQQPVNKSIAVGSSTSFGITATGAGLSYQWQVSTDGGNAWNNLTNGAPYSGVNTNTLQITGATLAMDGYKYKCQVSGTCSPPATSNPATLTVYAIITVTAPTMSTCPGTIVVPVQVTNCNNVGAISLVLAFNPSVLQYSSYQGLHPELLSGNIIINSNAGKVYFNWASFTPANVGSNTLVELVFTSVSIAASTLTWQNINGQCEFSNPAGQIIVSTYVNGNVTLLQPPAITQQPVNKSIFAGQNTSFSVAATGVGLTYQWQVSISGGSSWTNLTNVAPYSGTTSATLTITGATQAMNGYKFRCIAAGTCQPAATSNAATLTVTTPVTTTIGSISNSCTGNLVVPVNVLNCNNVGAISLVLKFNASQITYDGYQDVHPELSGGFLVVNQSNGKVLISWISTYPADILTGTLIRFRFILPSGSSNLTWDTQTQGACEYSDPDGNIIPGVFNNGTVSVISNPLIANAGPDVTITQGNSTTLNGTATGGSGTKTYSWSPTTYLSNPNIANPAATPPSSIIYTLTVTSGFCQASNSVSLTVLPVQGFTLHLTALMEGPFMGPEMSTNLISLSDFPLIQPYQAEPWNYEGIEQVTSLPNTDIVDWILVELRDAPTAAQATLANRIARKAAFLLKDGTIVGMDGSSDLNFSVTVNQNLFVVLWHRNHLGVMSAFPLSPAGGIYSYDFTTDDEKAYGGTNAHKQLAPGKWGMFSGDGDANNTIELTDKTGIWSPNAGKMGYLSGDFNLDGQVDNKDKNEFWLPNLWKSSQVPE